MGGPFGPAWPFGPTSIYGRTFSSEDTTFTFSETGIVQAASEANCKLRARTSDDVTHFLSDVILPQSVFFACFGDVARKGVHGRVVSRDKPYVTFGTKDKTYVAFCVCAVSSTNPVELFGLRTDPKALWAPRTKPV